MDYSLQNNLFYIEHKSIIYYIHIYKDLLNNDYIYDINLINNDICIFIKNKCFERKDNFKIKIIKANCNIDIDNNNNNNSCIILLQNIKQSSFFIGDISKFHYITLNNDNSKYIDSFISSYPLFDIDYYSINNSFLKGVIRNIEFIKMHWYYIGQYHPQFYFKYILYKYNNLILNLKYPKITYNENSGKNNTLLFIDDRYDPSFLYILTLFMYSVDESWNIKVYTIESEKVFYEEDFIKLGVQGKIYIIPNKFNDVQEYSNFLKNPDFWESIYEENCLLFQYDSFCGGKFNNDFLNYNYLGAVWDHMGCRINDTLVGNGGTSLRKKSVMEYICRKYNGLGGDLPEDVFFSLFLKEDGLLNSNTENDINIIAQRFSFENIFCNTSIYGHQIYKSIKRPDLDNFIRSKLEKMMN